MVMRKNNRKGSRKNRSTRRRVNRRNMYGGAFHLSPMELTDTSMVSASKMSGAQGLDFLGKHAAQHGGGSLMGAPVGDTGMLDSSLRASARMGPLDASYQAVVGMRDQSGGRRGRGASRRANRRTSRKTRRANCRTNRRNRRQNGGMRALGFMETSAPGMLLSGNQASAALSNMSREWALAENPSSFAPKLAGY